MEGKIQSGAETGYVDKTTHEQSNDNKVRSKCYCCNRNYPHTSVCPAMGKPVIFVINKTTLQQFVSQNSNRGPTEETANSPGKTIQTTTVKMESRNDTSSSASEDEYVFTTTVKNIKLGVYPTTAMTIGKENINFVIDTGATVNLTEELDYLCLKDVELKKTSTKIFP